MKCRHCGHELTRSFLDLGTAPASNAYLDESNLRSSEMWHPLRLLVCESCWLVQTEDYASREDLFSPDYAYFSSYSSSWLAHAKGYVDAMVERYALDACSRVVEVAANDGYLLQYVQERGIPCYGIEPTHSTAEAARSRGLSIYESFFGVELATSLALNGLTADLMVANNVLAHVPDINDFLRGFALLLKPDGVATFEFPHLLRMVQESQFDTVYHEHYSYLSLHCLEQIFLRNGLQVFDVEQLTTHGGSLRLHTQRSDAGRRPVASAVPSLIAQERAAGIDSQAFYADFQARAIELKCQLLTFLLQARSAGQRVGAYGAAAKGNTLLNFAGVRPDLLPYVVDRNPAKQGKYLPGSRIPIVNEDHLRADRPDWVLLLPWNLETELREQLAYVEDWGGKLITTVKVGEVLP
ncbi:class I SAM-dependent methyltransferase [Curvibacter sp. APW13]|uniref:class I SAM-dependent methyltransferase n=1 Tax=Curvibacter sp. APW13 TaxID=3077236 RepID=UPI0028DE3866|nr:class I SAM-dependent methyltransferase [Curvibacter sp. APW13]MDT8993020.1 class I SAM-dependent methyltransferase [Curvibacter sp. APW13]